jgi:hypothetical protein
MGRVGTANSKDVFMTLSLITVLPDQPLPLGLGSQRVISAPTDIKTVVTDGNLLYLGTSNGKVVTVPIPALKTSAAEHQFVLSQNVEREAASSKDVPVKAERESANVERERDLVKSPTSPREKKKGKKDKHSKGKDKESREDKAQKKDKVAKDEKLSQEMREEEKMREDKLMRERREEEKVLKEKKAMAVSHCLQFSAVSVHSHMDERVRDLLFLKLPELSLSKLKQAADIMQYHSLPNLASPYGGRIPVSPPILSFRSLMISVGKGHVEYIEEKETDDGEESTAEVHRERHEAFQLLVWGHKNST